MEHRWRDHWAQKHADHALLVWIIAALEGVMTEQDQLKGQLDNIETGITGVSARITDLLNQISAGNSNPSLQPLIDQATSEATQLQGLAARSGTTGETGGAPSTATPGTTPATSTPAPADQLVSGGEDVTVTPSTGVVVPTPGT